ncbi:hypothetical protein FRC01_012975 [Tulasnella sp. 417]|nr:hypothetical protein FRC01_012975 [Tulasnella sp. 417]
MDEATTINPSIDENKVRYEHGITWERSPDTLSIDSQTSIPYWVPTDKAHTNDEGPGLCAYCPTKRGRVRALKEHYKQNHLQTTLAPPGPRKRRPAATPNPPAADVSSGGFPSPSSSSESSRPPGLPDAFTTNDQVDWKVTIPSFLRSSGLAILGHYKVILCIQCMVCIPTEHVIGHLKDNHRFTDLDKARFRQFAQLGGLDGTPADIVAKVKKSRQFQQCPWLKQLPGWWCEHCGYATTSKSMSDLHRRQADHPFHEKTILLNGETHKTREQVVEGTVQTLFPVNVSGTIPSAISSVQNAPLEPASKVFQELQKLKEDLFNPPIISQDDPRSLHPFIVTSGFSEWIGKMTWDEVHALQKHMDTEVPTWGKRLVLHCKEMLKLSYKLCTPETYLARCIINSPSATTGGTPFGQLTTQESRDRYCSRWAGFIAYVINCKDVGVETRRFTLSPTQLKQLEYYIDLLKDPLSELDADARGSKLLDAVETLAVLSALLTCHDLEETGSSSRHPLIAYTILHSIQPGLIISNPVHISPFLASLEYFCRTTVMVLAYMASGDEADLTFFKAVKASSVWVKEGENTPFAWIRQMLHLTARFVYGTNQMPRFIWALDGGSSYTFDGYRIQVSEYTSMVKSAVQDAIDSFFDLWDSYGLPRDLLFTSFDEVDDALAVRSVNYNFARHPSNVKLQSRVEKCKNTMVDSKRFCSLAQGKLFWHPHAIRDAFAKSEAFLRRLAAALYLGSGQPPRGTELMSTLLTNIDTRVRNLFFSNNAAVLAHFLNKTTFLLKSDKAIVREVCPALSLVLLNYTAFLRPCEIAMAPVITPVDDIQWMQRRLFHIGSKQLNTEVLSLTLKSLWRRHVTRYGDTFKGWGTAETRQNAIYVGRRWVSTRELDKDGEALFDLQAGHCSPVARNWYGVEGNRLGGDMDPDQMAHFCCLSRAHHVVYMINRIPFRPFEPVDTPPPAAQPSSANANPPSSQNPSSIQSPPSSSSSQTPSSIQPPPLSSVPPALLFLGDLSASTAPAPPTQEDALSSSSSQGTLVASLSPPTASSSMLDQRALLEQVTPVLVDSVVKALGKMALPRDAMPLSVSSRGALSTTMSPEVFTAMREVINKGDDRRFRSVEQAAAAQAAWERKNHLLTVLPTGGGKTLVAEVTSRLERQGKMLNVIMVPLVALAEDLKDRFTKARVLVELWRGKETPFCQVLIAIFEQAGNDEFKKYLMAHVEKKTLARIVVDECHYPVFSTTEDFRPGMKSLARLATLQVPLVLLTATAPVSSTTELLDFYGVPQAKVIRASTNRPNIQYVVQQVPNAMLEEEPARHAFRQIKKAIEKYKPKRECKVLVYVQSRELLDQLWMIARSQQDETGLWMRYHAGMRPEEKRDALQGWVGVMLATCALGLGINPGDCGLVLHYQAPRSMLEYVQESGRAGRNGNPSSAVLLWNQKPQGDDEMIHDFLTTPLCRRRVIFGYMDGDAPDCLSLPQGNLLCDNCSKSIDQEAKTHKETLAPPNEIGPLVAQPRQIARSSRVAPLAPGVLIPLPPDLEIEPPTDLERVAKIAVVLNAKCSKCWLAGRSLTTHKLGEFNCIIGGRCGFNRTELEEYKRWKKDWLHPERGRFEKWACGYCWLPDEGYHDALKPKNSFRCTYADALGPLAWSMFHYKAILADYKTHHPEARTENLVDWAGWLSKAGPNGTPRFQDLALWLDDKMEATDGRYSLWNYG